MASSLSNLVNNFSEQIHRTKSKYGHGDEKYETCGITTKYTTVFSNTKNFTDDLIEKVKYAVTKIIKASLMNS